MKEKTNSNNSNKSLYIVLAAIVIIPIILINVFSRMPGQYDQLAQCITDSGAKFYGAFWCPHCQKQKAMFGKSAKLLPYIECSTPDKNQTQVCKDAGIKGYPTWVFADGSQASGEVPLQNLAEKTSCSQFLK
jgi:thiol-disulfide isomerase/thioredoxin